MMIYSYLLLQMEYDVCFSIVDMERSLKYPQGCFKTEFIRLKGKYESTSQYSGCDVKL